MLETPFSFLISKKPGEIPIFGTFWRKSQLNLAYFAENLHFQVGHALLCHYNGIR